MNNITQGTTKYYSVVSALNSEVLFYVTNIIKNPPSIGLYSSLKERLIAMFTDSEQKRVKDSLMHTVLENENPSHLLRKMRQLFQKKVGEKFLKTLWIQRPPKETQAILSVSEGNLSKLAQMADKIIEVAIPQVAETEWRSEQNNKNTPVLELQVQIADLNDEVKQLSDFRHRQKNIFQDRSTYKRYRSQTPKRNKGGITRLLPTRQDNAIPHVTLQNWKASEEIAYGTM